MLVIVVSLRRFVLLLADGGSWSEMCFIDKSQVVNLRETE